MIDRNPRSLLETEIDQRKSNRAAEQPRGSRRLSISGNSSNTACNNQNPASSRDQKSGAAAHDPCLGSIAQFSSVAEESADQQQQPAPSSADDRLRVLYDRQRVVQKLLHHEPKAKRIVKCARELAPLAAHAYVVDNGERAAFRNLVQCDSYCCPVCAPRRSETDRRELTAAMVGAARQNLKMIHLTPTMSHKLGDRLDDLQAALSKAFNRMFSGRWWDDLSTKLGVEGKITVVEETISPENGWHPHRHVLILLRNMPSERSEACPTCGGAVFTSGSYARCTGGCAWQGEASEVIRSYSLDDLQADLAARWARSVAALGYSASLEHGCKLTTAESEIAAYVTKYGHEPIDRHRWGADSEIAKGYVKTGRHGSFTVADLTDVMRGENEALKRFSEAFGYTSPDDAIARAGALYAEFVRASYRRHRIRWGNGLRELLGVDDILHEQAQQQPEKPQDLNRLVIERESMKNIARRNLRAEVLIAVRKASAADDRNMLARWLCDHQVDALILWEKPSERAQPVGVGDWGNSPVSGESDQQSVGGERSSRADDSERIQPSLPYFDAISAPRSRAAHSYV